VYVGSADARTPHANQDFVISHRRLGNVLQLEAWCGRLFHESFQRRLLRLVIARQRDAAIRRVATRNLAPAK
jgi:hypothetical protein